MEGEILHPGELWCQAQIGLEHWSCLLNAPRGVLKPEKCFWYLIGYVCKESKWIYAEMVPREMAITNQTALKAPSSRKR